MDLFAEVRKKYATMAGELDAKLKERVDEQASGKEMTDWKR